MRSLLHQLENNEAVLLMYLAGELPPHDRADVEQMLATDAGLRAELARLSETVGRLDAAMAHLDAADHRLTPADVAARRVGRMVAQWHADRTAAAAARRPAKPAGGVPRWAYPLGAMAACALISGGIWWVSDPGGRRTTTVVDGTPATTTSTIVEAVDDDVTGGALAERPSFLLPPDVDVDGVAAETTEGGSAGTDTTVASAWTDRFDALEADLSALSADIPTTTNLFTAPELERDGF